MILTYPQLDDVIEFPEGCVPSIVVEAPAFLRAFLQDLYDQIDGAEGEAVLSDDGKRLPIGSRVEIIGDFLGLKLNGKTLQNKIIAQMGRMASEETFYVKTAEIMQRVEQYVGELAFAFDCDIVCNSCTVTALLKAMGVSIRDEYDNPLERLLDYMELVREFEQDKVFVLLNMRSFFSDGEVETFLSTAMQHGYHILLVDGYAQEKLSIEKRITIDKDLCVF